MKKHKDMSIKSGTNTGLGKKTEDLTNSRRGATKMDVSHQAASRIMDRHPQDVELCT